MPGVLSALSLDLSQALFVIFLPLVVCFLGAAFFLIAFFGGLILGACWQKRYQLIFYKKMISMISIKIWMLRTELVNDLLRSWWTREQLIVESMKWCDLLSTILRGVKRVSSKWISWNEMAVGGEWNLSGWIVEAYQWECFSAAGKLS